MQQEPTQPQPAPTPPPTAAPEPGTAVTAVFPGGSIALQGVPASPQEVAGLRQRREILRDQLSRASNRREELVSQLNETGNPEARTGLQQRLTLLDERLLQIERDQALTEQLLANTPPEVLAITREAERAPGSGANDGEATAIAFMGFAAGIFLAWLIGKYRRRRSRKHQQLELPNDPRFERLNQAVDAIAEEVERIGEGQRFVTQLLSQRRESAALKGNRDSATSS